MKAEKFIIKPVTLLLATILMLFILSSCEYKPEPPEKNAFELVMDFSETVVKKGSTVTYRAILRNNAHEAYTLLCPHKPIYISVVKAEDVSKENPVFASSAESDIAPHGQIEEFYDFTPEEKGTYILKAYSSFTIEGKESTKDYFYECEEIEITVK